MLVIVIGRGAGGTRLISQALAQSGIYMGPTNDSGDMVPPQKMYAAVHLASKLVVQTAPLQWDFSQLLEEDPPPGFVSLVKEYLAPLDEVSGPKGWKLPETLFAFPWIVKMFPQAKYIYWTRDPRVAIFKKHLTDKIRRFGAPGISLHEVRQDPYRDRLESWVYQASLVEASPKPAAFLTIRYEDFVLRQQTELARVSEFLGILVKPVQIDPKKTEMPRDVGNLVPPDILAHFGYAPKR